MIVDRYVELLRAGKLRFVNQAVVVCARELAQEHPNGKRTRGAVGTGFYKRRRLAADVRPLRL